MQALQVLFLLYLVSTCVSIHLPLFLDPPSTTATPTTEKPSFELIFLFNNHTIKNLPVRIGSKGQESHLETEGNRKSESSVLRSKRGKMEEKKESHGDGHHFEKLMKLIEAAKLQDCAGRVVCDLNCDFTRFGSSGKKLMDLMTKVQNSGSVPAESISFLVTAGLSGKMYYWTSSCDRCKTGYPDCFAESEELIDVASIFDVDF